MMHCGNIKHDDFEIQSYELCRICLKDGKISIFRNNATLDIADSIHTITGIQISDNDAYPKYICQPCHELLQGAILFRKNAVQSDKQLKGITKTIKTENDCDFEDYTVHNKIEISIEYEKPQKIESHIKKSISEPDTPDSDNVIFENDALHCLKQEEPKHPKFYEGLNCKRCNLQFNTFEEYCKHRLTDDHENKKHLCPICNNSYSRSYIKRHMARHKQEKSYMCDICGREFILELTFKRHRLTHSFNLPFKCSLCPYKGRFSESLKMHMRSHTGERPYQCDECPARFISKSNLIKHIKTHKNQFDFSCEECGRGVNTKQELEMHIKVAHKGIKDYICKICNKAFGYRKQMMKHELSVHKREKLRSGKMPLYLQVESMNQHDTSPSLET